MGGQLGVRVSHMFNTYNFFCNDGKWNKKALVGGTGEQTLTWSSLRRYFRQYLSQTRRLQQTTQFKMPTPLTKKFDLFNVFCILNIFCVDLRLVKLFEFLTILPKMPQRFFLFFDTSHRWSLPAAIRTLQHCRYSRETWTRIGVLLGLHTRAIGIVVHNIKDNEIANQKSI